MSKNDDKQIRWVSYPAERLLQHVKITLGGIPIEDLPGKQYGPPNAKLTHVGAQCPKCKNYIVRIYHVGEGYTQHWQSVCRDCGPID